jgi:hypothetical protein
VIRHGPSQTARASMTRDSWRQKNSLERAYHEIISDGIRGRAAESTIEALMYSLRQGVNDLTRPDTKRRLSELSEYQLRTVIERLRNSKSEIAPSWTPEEAEALAIIWSELK